MYHNFYQTFFPFQFDEAEFLSIATATPASTSSSSTPSPAKPSTVPFSYKKALTSNTTSASSGDSSAKATPVVISGVTIPDHVPRPDAASIAQFRGKLRSLFECCLDRVWQRDVVSARLEDLLMAFTDSHHRYFWRYAIVLEPECGLAAVLTDVMTRPRGGGTLVSETDKRIVATYKRVLHQISGGESEQAASEFGAIFAQLSNLSLMVRQMFSLLQTESGEKNA